MTAQSESARYNTGSQSDAVSVAQTADVPEQTQKKELNMAQFD